MVCLITGGARGAFAQGVAQRLEDQGLDFIHNNRGPTITVYVSHIIILQSFSIGYNDNINGIIGEPLYY